MRREIAWAASLLGCRFVGSQKVFRVVRPCCAGGEWWPAVLRNRESLLVVAISLVVLEIALRRRSGSDMSTCLPSYSIRDHRPVLGRLDEHFGVWHRPQVRYRHRKSCFDITYTSNSHGMRDKEVALSSQVRACGLGGFLRRGIWDRGRLALYRPVGAEDRHRTPQFRHLGRLRTTSPMSFTRRWPRNSIMARSSSRSFHPTISSTTCRPTRGGAAVPAIGLTWSAATRLRASIPRALVQGFQLDFRSGTDPRVHPHRPRRKYGHGHAETIPRRRAGRCRRKAPPCTSNTVDGSTGCATAREHQGDRRDRPC